MIRQRTPSYVERSPYSLPQRPQSSKRSQDQPDCSYTIRNQPESLNADSSHIITHHAPSNSGSFGRPPKRRRVDEAERESTPSRDGYKPQSQNKRAYTCTEISGNAQVVQGDMHGNIIHNYPEQRAQEDSYDVLLKSLTFDRMDARLCNIAKALPKTCQWLFHNKQFTAWIDDRQIADHHGFFWIKGKPGSGKSTMMKIAYEWAKRKWSKQIIISYFFNARAPGRLEKSSLGLYRSLVHQILKILPEARANFLSKFSSKENDGFVDEWTPTELKEFLIDIVANPENPRVNIFVDALDEGAEDDIRQMVAFFEELGLHAISAEAQLRICLSSRHYPHISIRKGLSIVVEEQPEHGRDIEFYVENKLHGEQAPEMRELQQEICCRSAGVFLWVVLVVPMLNTTHDQGGSLEATSRHLKTIPTELDTLFTEILAKCTEDMEGCLSLLQWVVFSARPLTPTELYLAIHHSYTSPRHGAISIPDPNRLQKYLLNCSRGLVEITASKPPVMQFIHETVRGFLINSNGLAQIESKLAANIEGLSHAKLRSTCLQFLKHSGALDNHSELKSTRWARRNIASGLEDKFPFLEYAVKYIFLHADTAQSYGIPQTDFLEAMSGNAAEDFRRWIQFRNLLERYATRKYTLNVSLLYVATEQNLINLVRCLVEGRVDINSRGERYGSALQAACIAGHEEIARLLLESGADISAEGGEHGSVLSAAIYGKNTRIVTLLRGYGASLKAQTIAKIFPKTIERGYLEGVRLLLDIGADVRKRDAHGRTMLYIACCKKDPAVAELLLQREAIIDVNAQGQYYGSALQAASGRGHEKIVQTLLNAGADVNAQGGFYGNALQAASDKGREKIAQTLLDVGADVNAQGGHYGNALQAASRLGREKKVQTMLDAGADVNAQGGYYGNALQAASSEGHEKIVQTLLDAGADVNAQGGYYGSALQAASTGGHEKIVQTLLDVGADVNAQGGYYGNALQAVSTWGHLKIVQTLLDAGADVNAQGGHYGNALQASSEGHEKIVQTLLDAGADVNAQGGYYGSALQAASTGDHEKTVRALLDAGADVNAQGGTYGSALRAASRWGHEKIVQTLLKMRAKAFPDE